MLHTVSTAGYSLSYALTEDVPGFGNAALVSHSTFRSDVLAGKTLIGAWCMLADPLSARIMGNAGYDWLVVDMEHGPIPLPAAQAMVTAIGCTPAVPLIRPAWRDSASVQVALDCGPRGIIVPMIETVAEAAQVVKDTRFVPLGERSRGGVRAALEFGLDANTYFREANDGTTVIVQIETARAVDAAYAIAAHDGIDCLFVGPFDLAGSFGAPWPGIWDDLHGPYAEAIELVPRVARQHGKAAGILANDIAMAERCLAFGYTVVGIAIDVVALSKAARAEREALRIG